LPRIVVRDLTTAEEHHVAFDAEAYSLGFENVFEFDQTTMRSAYSSMATPREVYDYTWRRGSGLFASARWRRRGFRRATM